LLNAILLFLHKLLHKWIVFCIEIRANNEKGDSMKQ